jgi:hypothetical protein
MSVFDATPRGHRPLYNQKSMHAFFQSSLILKGLVGREGLFDLCVSNPDKH